MHKITLVCSVHRENGLCNAGELIKILRAIQPETVFEEIRPSDFDSYCKHGAKSNLEAQAVARYREFKSFQRVPVDRYDMPANLVETQRAIDYALQANQEYLELDEENLRSAYELGFGYLNSVACERMMARISEIEEKTIIGTGDQGLVRGLETWRHLMQSRDREMIGNIYEYCRENVFDTGVFLVGAGHKMGIVKEIEKYASAEADLIDWKLCL